MKNVDRVVEFLDTQDFEEHTRKLMAKKISKKFRITLAHAYRLYDNYIRSLRPSRWLP